MRNIKLLKHTVILAVMLLAIPASATADPFKEGINAFNRKDYVIALELFQVAAKDGNVAAQFNVGIMYQDGIGIPKDYVKALKWYTKAANQGDVAAQMGLSVMYEKGLGTNKDYIQAYKWSYLALAQGHRAATQLHRRITSYLSAEQLEEANKLVRDWKSTQ